MVALRRVVLECDDAVLQDGLQRVLVEHGFEVSVCGGPSTHSTGCPLLESGRCGLIDDAGLVVHALDPSDSTNRSLLTTLLQAHPETSVVIETDLHSDDEPDNVRKVRFPMSRASLLAAIDQAPPGGSER